MLSLSEIIKVIKNEKSLKKNKDVANLLGIEAKQFATAKSRNSIPYEKLTSFCNKEGWSLNWLLTGSGEKYQKSKDDETKEIDPKLKGLLEKVKYIFKEGDIKERISVRGTIEEIYDEIVAKKTENKEG